MLLRKYHWKKPAIGNALFYNARIYWNYITKWPISIVRYAVISLIHTLSAMVFWCFLNKISNISFVLAFLIVGWLEWIYLGCIYCGYGVDDFLYANIDWFGLYPTCWCAKQLFDFKRRELAVEFFDKTKNFLKAISSGVLFLLIHLLVFMATIIL